MTEISIIDRDLPGNKPGAVDPTPEDIGRAVVYQAGHPGAEPEQGIITSFNDYGVFVRYGSNPQSQMTSRCDLRWAFKR